MTAQIVFHGINRSAAVEAAVNEKLEGSQVRQPNRTLQGYGDTGRAPNDGTFHHPCGSRRIRAQFDRYTHESGRHGCPYGIV